MTQPKILNSHKSGKKTAVLSTKWGKIKKYVKPKSGILCCDCKFGYQPREGATQCTIGECNNSGKCQKWEHAW